MISEPELVDENGAPLEQPETEEAPDRTPGPARPRRRDALWALGGAVVASALWAGALFAYEPVESGDPDLGAYRASRDLCADAELKALTAAHGAALERVASGRAHPTMDRTNCWVRFDGGEGESGSSSVTYTRHKKTDPGPQFTGAVTVEDVSGNPETDPARVDGLGERAYFILREGGNRFHLQVLDGQTVLGMELELPWRPGEGLDSAERREVEAAMVEDMRALMKKLQS